MSSSPPQPPPRTQRPLHNFNLASDLMWSTKSRSTRNTTSRHRSSSSSWNASEFGSTNRSPFSFPPQHSLESRSFMQGLYLSPAMNFNDKESGCIDKNTTRGDKQVIFGSEKNVGTSIDQGKPVQENIDKQIKAIGESKQGYNKKKKNKMQEKKKKKTKKKKSNEKEQKQEQEIEIKPPEFSVQLTSQEIEDDIFAMTGSKPTKMPKKRGKNSQTKIDQLTPGLWLESVDTGRYKVEENVRKRK